MTNLAIWRNCLAAVLRRPDGARASAAAQRGEAGDALGRFDTLQRADRDIGFCRKGFWDQRRSETNPRRNHQPLSPGVAFDGAAKRRVLLKQRKVI